MRRVNLERLEIVHDADDPAGYGTGSARVGSMIEASALGGTLYELPEGQSICPYHYEYGREEWLIVLVGRPTLRHPDGEDVLEPGDVVCFPAGPAGAHKVTNTDAEPARVLFLSDKLVPNVCVYPDSGKVGIYGVAEDSLMVRKESGVDYFDGEV